MHTFKSVDGITFNHDAGLVGETHITDSEGGVIILPTAAVVEFVSQLVLTHKIAKLEQASTVQILGIEDI